MFIFILSSYLTIQQYKQYVLCANMNRNSGSTRFIYLWSKQSSWQKCRTSLDADSHALCKSTWTGVSVLLGNIHTDNFVKHILKSLIWGEEFKTPKVHCIILARKRGCGCRSCMVTCVCKLCKERSRHKSDIWIMNLSISAWNCSETLTRLLAPKVCQKAFKQSSVAVDATTADRKRRGSTLSSRYQSFKNNAYREVAQLVKKVQKTNVKPLSLWEEENPRKGEAHFALGSPLKGPIEVIKL